MTDLLTRHITHFNDGIRTGDFGPMVAWFTEDAELIFENIPVGPFHGHEAIAAAYASQPPDDEIVLLETREEDGLIIASYAWTSAPDQHAGDMVITPDGGRIARLLVVYGGLYRQKAAPDDQDSNQLLPIHIDREPLSTDGDLLRWRGFAEEADRLRTVNGPVDIRADELLHQARREAEPDENP